MGVQIPPGLDEDLISKLKTFLKEIYLELRKVSWPGRKELIGSTAVVIMLSITVAIIIGILDFIYSHGLIAVIAH